MEQKKLLKAELIAIEALQVEHAKRVEGLRAVEAELKTIQVETAERLGLTVEVFLTARFDNNGVLTFPPSPVEQAIEKVAEQVIAESKPAPDQVIKPESIDMFASAVEGIKDSLNGKTAAASE